MKTSRGFSMLELLVAGTVSTVVIGFAIMTIAQIQSASAAQRKDIELASQARLAMELMGRDIRGAADAVQFLPYHCIAGMQSPGTPDGCSAILDPHPWRITIARNAWMTPAGETPGTEHDTISSLPFHQNPNNVISYQFVPRRTVMNGTGVIGHIERIVNPFGFMGEEPQGTILLDNVLLDERMKLDPTGHDSDPAYDHALFLYQLLSVADEYVGDPEIVARVAGRGSFLLPPMRFFAIPNPLDTPLAPIVTNAPYLGDYPVDIIGLDPHSALSPTTPLQSTLGSFEADMRYILDYNRIRAVRVAFKVIEPREDRDYNAGIDLDHDTPGTSRIFSIESVFEVKIFSSLQ